MIIMIFFFVQVKETPAASSFLEVMIITVIKWAIISGAYL